MKTRKKKVNQAHAVNALLGQFGAEVSHHRKVQQEVNESVGRRINELTESVRALSYQTNEVQHKLREEFANGIDHIRNLESELTKRNSERNRVVDKIYADAVKTDAFAAELAAKVLSIDKQINARMDDLYSSVTKLTLLDIRVRAHMDNPPEQTKPKPGYYWGRNHAYGGTGPWLIVNVGEDSFMVNVGMESLPKHTTLPISYLKDWELIPIEPPTK